MIEGDAGEGQLTPEQELDQLLEGASLGSAKLLATRDVAREENLAMEVSLTVPESHDPTKKDSELKKLSAMSAELGALRQRIGEREETIEGYGHARSKAQGIFEKLYRGAKTSQHTIDATFTAAKKIIDRTSQITKRPTPPTNPQG